MRDILVVLSASEKTTKPNEKFENERFLTLTDCYGNSANRYYVRLTGKPAEVDWQEGDRIMVDMHLHAYKNHGLWLPCHDSNALKLIDIGQIIEDYEERKGKEGR